MLNISMRDGLPTNNKVVILGDSHIGKTSLVTRFAEGYYRENSRPATIGAFFVTKRIQSTDNARSRATPWPAPAFRRRVRLEMRPVVEQKIRKGQRTASWRSRGRWRRLGKSTQSRRTSASRFAPRRSECSPASACTVKQARRSELRPRGFCCGRGVSIPGGLPVGGHLQLLRIAVDLRRVDAGPK